MTVINQQRNRPESVLHLPGDLCKIIFPPSDKTPLLALISLRVNLRY